MENSFSSEKTKTRLPLPIGVSSYVEAVSNYYYVDKTLLIRDFIDALPKVSLFTRPRRFGKTLNMDMLRVFFEKPEGNEAEDTSVYFRDKEIWNCGEKYRSMQGQYPVIFLTFKDVKYQTWKEARKDIWDNIRMEFSRHSSVMECEGCSNFEKDLYCKILAGNADEVDMARSLALLSAMLHKQVGKPAVVIIDEYDTPIQQGHLHGYYDEVIGFLRNLFSGVLKDNADLAYGFLTGILRVAKESIFSGLNNLKVNTIMDDRYSAYFGFTRDEVQDLLMAYGCADHYEEVCDWYDGYRFGNSEIFNPWSVINYVDDGCVPRAFWQATGSNDVIGEIIQNASPEVTENLRSLLQGGQVTTYIDTNVIYPEISQNPSTIYSFLLVAGYLKTAEIMPRSDGNFVCRVAIPNKEISLVYEKEIISRLSMPDSESTAAKIQQALMIGDIPSLTSSITDYMLKTISVHDTAGEAFYQGLMLGLCAILNNRYEVLSNRESGLGRFDIQLCPLDQNLPGYILELKASRKENGKSLDSLAEDALNQIEEKQYDQEMKQKRVNRIIKIGIAFHGKNAAVRYQ